MIRWPGLVPAHTEINEVFSAEDWATTLVAAAGEPAVKEKLLQGYDAAGQTFKVHLDGYDQRDLLSRKGPDKRREFSIGQTTAISPACAMISGRRCSWSKRLRASVSGSSR